MNREVILDVVLMGEYFYLLSECTPKPGDWLFDGREIHQQQTIDQTTKWCGCKIEATTAPNLPGVLRLHVGFGDGSGLDFTKTQQAVVYITDDKKLETIMDGTVVCHLIE